MRSAPSLSPDGSPATTNRRGGSATADSNSDDADLPLVGGAHKRLALEQQALAGLDRNHGNTRRRGLRDCLGTNCGQVNEPRLAGLARFGEDQRNAVADKPLLSQCIHASEELTGPTRIFRGNRSAAGQHNGLPKVQAADLAGGRNGRTRKTHEVVRDRWPGDVPLRRQEIGNDTVCPNHPHALDGKVRKQRDGESFVAHGSRQPSGQSESARYRDTILIRQGHAAGKHQVGRAESADRLLDRRRPRDGNVENHVAFQIVSANHVNNLQSVAAALSGFRDALGQRP